MPRSKRTDKLSAKVFAKIRKRFDARDLHLDVTNVRVCRRRPFESLNLVTRPKKRKA